ncbi:MAG: hypothetical protein CMJ89_17320 [Planctomycetes bacterium]|jgi:hypothetical protein|nr:hypothetical protein [Planctomycetota bacterium]
MDRAFFKHSLAPLLLLSAACATSSRQEQALGSKDPTRGDGPRPEPARLYSDVAWLADDAREGRRAGTRGELAAARWLAARLESLGTEPLGTQGFLQAFQVPLTPLDRGGSFLAGEDGTGRTRFDDAENVVPLFCSGGAEAQGPLVFAGYGIAADDLGWNDYGDGSVEGAIVVVVRGTPPVERIAAATVEGETAENPHGSAPTQSSSWQGMGALFHKVIEAKRRGALAVVVAQHPTRLEPLPPFNSGRGAQANIPALMISAKVVEAFLPEYADLVGRLDRGDGVERPRRVGAATVRADVVRESGTAYNVLARIPGRVPGRTVVVGAHFDHLGRGGPGSLAPQQQGQIHNGADDNASGTAVCLEIARILMEEKPAGDVVIALWSGEELGLLGSEYWARAPTLDLSVVSMNINLDMVGRAASGKLSVLGAGTAEDFEAWLDAAGPKAALELQVNLSGQGVGGSDHQTFIKRDIPALHLFTGLHSDYHRPSDDVEGFHAEGASQVASLTLDLLARAHATSEILWAEPAVEAVASPRGGFRTRFGSIPDYAYDGTGLRLDGTSPGGPAEHAGLLRGDVIYSIDDVEIEGMGDFMYVLNAHKPGDVITVRYVRDGDRESVPLTLESTQAE